MALSVRTRPPRSAASAAGSGARSTAVRVAKPLLIIKTERATTVARSVHGSQDTRHYADTATLYTELDADGSLAPDSHAVTIALLEKRVPFSTVNVGADPAARPPEFEELRRAIAPPLPQATSAAAAAAAPAAAPLLVDAGGARLVDARVILEYLEARYRGQGARLLPDDAEAAARARLFAAFFRDAVAAPYARLVHADGAAAAADAARAALLDGLAAVDAFLRLHGGAKADGAAAAVGPHGGFVMREADEEAGGFDMAAAGVAAGPYLLGRQYSLAEVAATPLVYRLVRVLPEWGGLDVVDEASRRGLTRVVSWMQACLERPSAAQTAPGQAELIGGLAGREAARTA